MRAQVVRNAFFVALLLATAASGQEEEKVSRESRIAKQSATSTGDRGLFNVISAETLGKRQFSFGTGWSNASRSPKDISISSLPLYFSYGVIGRLTVTGTFEVQREVDVRDSVQPGFYNSLPFALPGFRNGAGDMWIAAKYRLQQRPDNISGIAVRGFVKIPTADSGKGLGTGSADAGADLLFTSILPGRFVMNSNLGYTSLGDPASPTRVRLKNELRTGIGAAWPSGGIDVSAGSLQGIVDFYSTSFVGRGAFNPSIQSPSDLTVGLRYLSRTGITVDAGFRANTQFDTRFATGDRKGFTASLSYTKPAAGIRSTTNHSPVVALEADRTDIPGASTATITATGFDQDNDRLSYSWSASGGQITISGDRVLFSSANIPAGKYTVRVVVNDGRGGTADGAIEITVR